MEQGGINLKKFAPQNAKKWYIVKVLIYALVLGGMLYYLSIQINRKKEKLNEEIPLDRMEVEVESN